jgi:hypothetical protein
MTETKFRSYFLNMSAIISDSGIRVNPIIHVGGLQVADIKARVSHYVGIYTALVLCFLQKDPSNHQNGS